MARKICGAATGSQGLMSGLLMALVVASATAGYLPQPQTTRQAASFARMQRAATKASPLATPRLLALLDSAELRANLSAPLKRVASAELRRRWRAELQVAEIAHGFHAKNDPTQNNALDLDIAMASSAAWFYNQWQMPLLFPAREDASYYELISYLAPAGALEAEFYGLQKFSAPVPFAGVSWPGGWPASVAEASDRVVYAVLNQHKTDFPCFYWGDVAVVFNNTYVRDMTILNPMDSGDYTCDCPSPGGPWIPKFCASFTNETACKKIWYCGSWDAKKGVCGGRPPSKKSPVNCSDWTGEPFRTVGTLSSGEHAADAAADHTLWSFSQWETGGAMGTPAQKLASLLNRMLLQWDDEALPNMTVPQFDYYFEANLLGNPRFPEAVSFLIADMTVNFGTAEGRAIQAWAGAKGWPLLWALGSNTPPSPTPAPGNHPRSWRATGRVMDPQVQLATAAGTARAGRNLTAAAKAAAPPFDALWRKVAGERAALQKKGGGKRPSVAQYEAWWAQLDTKVAPAGLRLQPMRAGACLADAKCVGVDAEGHCVCY